LRDLGILEFWNCGIQEFWNLEIGQSLNSQSLNSSIRNSQFPNSQFPNSDSPNSTIPEFAIPLLLWLFFLGSKPVHELVLFDESQFSSSEIFDIIPVGTQALDLL
jgi:hypothetical protein